MDLPIKNGDFPIKNGDFPIKHGDFPIKHGDFPIKNGDFPSFFVCLPKGNVKKMGKSSASQSVSVPALGQLMGCEAYKDLGCL